MFGGSIVGRGIRSPVFGSLVSPLHAVVVRYFVPLVARVCLLLEVTFEVGQASTKERFFKILFITVSIRSRLLTDSD